MTITLYETRKCPCCHPDEMGWSVFSHETSHKLLNFLGVSTTKPEYETDETVESWHEHALLPLTELHTLAQQSDTRYVYVTLKPRDDWKYDTSDNGTDSDDKLKDE